LISKEQMQAAGFTWDPARGYERWTHFGKDITCLRQPFMDDDRWDREKSEAIQRAGHQLTGEP